MYPSLIRRKAWLLPLILVGLVVAFSRVVVGAHWPADVLAGMGLGIWIAWLAMQSEKLWPWTSFLNTRPGNWLLLVIEVGLVVFILVTAPAETAAIAAMAVVAVVGFLGAGSRYLGLQHLGARG
jgi:hypothetical protein